MSKAANFKEKGIGFAVAATFVIYLISLMLLIKFNSFFYNLSPEQLCKNPSLETDRTPLLIALIAIVSLLIIIAVYREGWKNTFKAFVAFTLGIMLSTASPFGPQSFIFPPDYHPPVVIKGWTVLQPLGSSIAYKSSNQSFSAGFNNAVGTSIKITGVNVTETLSGQGGTTCSATVDGKNSSSLDSRAVMVAAGSSFVIEADCQGAGIQVDDPYDLNLTVNYDSSIGGNIIHRTEMGVIRGTAGC